MFGLYLKVVYFIEWRRPPMSLPKVAAVESFNFASFPIIFSSLFVAYWEALLPTVATGCNKPSEWETIECIKCLLDKSMYLAKKPPNVPKLVHHNLSIMMLYYLRKRRLRSPCMKRRFRKGVKTGVYDKEPTVVLPKAPPI